MNPCSHWGELSVHDSRSLRLEMQKFGFKTVLCQFSGVVWDAMLICNWIAVHSQNNGFHSDISSKGDVKLATCSFPPGGAMRRSISNRSPGSSRSVWTCKSGAVCWSCTCIRPSCFFTMCARLLCTSIWHNGSLDATSMILHLTSFIEILHFWWAENVLEWTVFHWMLFRWHIVVSLLFYIAIPIPEVIQCCHLFLHLPIVHELISWPPAVLVFVFVSGLCCLLFGVFVCFVCFWVFGVCFCLARWQLNGLCIDPIQFSFVSHCHYD